MHYYADLVNSQIVALRARIRELEEIAASSELMIDAAWDELDACRGRERRLLWTAIALGVVAAVAITRLAMGR